MRADSASQSLDDVVKDQANHIFSDNEDTGIENQLQGSPESVELSNNAAEFQDSPQPTSRCPGFDVFLQPFNQKEPNKISEEIAKINIIKTKRLILL